MSWKGAIEVAERHSGGEGGGLFVSLKDGDKATGVFCGEPLGHEVVWDQAAGHSVAFDATVHDKKEGRGKFAFNFLDCSDPGSKEMRVIELNTTTFKALYALTQQIEGDLSDWVCSITRRGSDKKTVYWIQELQQLEGQQLEGLKSTIMHDSHDLAEVLGLGAGQGPGGGGGGSGSGGGSVTIAATGKTVTQEDVKKGSSYF